MVNTIVEPAKDVSSAYCNGASNHIRPQTIGVVVNDINVSYFTDIIKGVENIAYSRNYNVLIGDTNNKKEKEADFLNLLLDKTVDGLILVQPLHSESEISHIADKGYFIGVIGRHMTHEKIPCVYTDNVKFSKEVVTHLVKYGHRDIVFLCGYKDVVDNDARLEGYLRALHDYYIPFRPELLEYGDFNEEGAYEAMKRLMTNNTQFTAVFAANDEMALGVYKACREYGISIPSQIAVVGVDNNRISKYITPTLSTVNQPKYTMGALLADKLIDQMGNDEFRDKRVFKICSQLIVRQSSDYIRSKR